MLKKSSSEHQLVVFWAPFLLLHLGGQDNITAYALEDNKLWLRHLLNMLVQVAATTYVLYKYTIAFCANFVHADMLVLAAGVLKYRERIWALKLASKGGSRYIRRRPIFRCRWFYLIKEQFIIIKEQFIQAKTVTVIEHREGRDCFTKNKQFRTYVFIVMTALSFLYIAHRMLFGQQTLQAPITFVDHQSHKFLELFEMFCYVFLRGCTVGAPRVGAATTFPSSYSYNISLIQNISF